MRRLLLLLLLAACAPALSRASLPLHDTQEQVRAFTRPLEFDYVRWTLRTAAEKLQAATLGLPRYLPAEEQSQRVRQFMALVAQIQLQEAQLSALHADPQPARVAGQIEATRAQLEQLNAQRRAEAPLAESILQAQMSTILAEQGFALGGQPIPPVLYHSTPLPWALIVSPRDAIRQEANISLETELSLEQQIALEEQVADTLDVATLVVPVGGIGTYPTMVAQTSALNWLCEVVAHEWLHNYLAWHALGWQYAQAPELTTMNETTANLFGKEIGALLIARYYPEYAPSSAPAPSPRPARAATMEPPRFDFRQEMHTTRLHVDALLAAGQVAAAEDYMEARRLIFWENGYPLRKLNQAYFAFYGSYADTPTGPAGEDPVGAAVRQLRAASPSLLAFVHTMQSLTSFAQLQAQLNQAP
ncbi:MAG: hypothetical protein KIT07_05125 [Anaerolineales bacterium]|nr:hypothetical protein [Anaerolineales bacterium]